MLKKLKIGMFSKKDKGNRKKIKVRGLFYS